MKSINRIFSGHAMKRHLLINILPSQIISQTQNQIIFNKNSIKKTVLQYTIAKIDQFILM